MTHIQKNMRAADGFTLVELAIVMIIIGLLIAGVLKGQALIQNAQVTSTVAQTKAIEAAISTFRDTFNALPGDMSNANTRLPNCAGVCSAVAGNGDGQLNNTPAVTPIGKEGEAFFVQLNAANLLSGLAPAVAGSTTIGANFPAAKISNIPRLIEDPKECLR